MHLLLALLPVAATCVPDAALAGEGAIRVRAYFVAINARDADAVGRFLRPGATYSRPGLEALPLAGVMTQLLETPQAERLDVVEATARGDRVFVRTQTFPSGTRASATVLFDGGCVSRFVQEE